MKLPVAILLALSILSTCGGSSGYPTGGEKGRCYPNGTCNVGLTCLSDTCVNASPAGGAGGSARLDGATDTTSSGGNGPDAPVGTEVDVSRDVAGQDISMTSTGGVTGIDAPQLADVGTAGRGGNALGGAFSTGGVAGPGGGSGSGDASSTGGAINTGGSSSSGSGGGGAGNGGSGRGGSGGGGLDGGGASGSDGANCGVVQVTASRVPADLLLVLDRSGAMDYSIAEDCYCPSGGTPVCASTTSCTDRWSALTSAVDAMLTSATAVNWGLKLYPSPGGSSCTVSSNMEVPISATSSAAIRAQIANATVGNNTPTAAAITAATAYLETVADAHGKAILLATDGEPNCKAGSPPSADVSGTATAIAAAWHAGFLVYVVGIGPSVGNLDNFAQAGGTGRYYPATSTTELTNAFAAIGQASATCTFAMASAPPDPNNLAVYLDKAIVPRDSSNGWSFGASSQTIQFGGSSCDRITSGAASNVQILFGCPDGPPFPQVLP